LDLAAADELVAAAPLEVEQQDEVGNELLRRRLVRYDGSHTRRLARRHAVSQLRFRFRPGIRRRIRHANALVLLRAGHRPGGFGLKPHRRRRALKARASASAKLQLLRQVRESEMDGAGPFFTWCGAITGT